MAVLRMVAVLMVLVCLGAAVGGCSGQDERVDLRPLPTVATPPYICGHIPLEAVERMTALRAPRHRGSFGRITGVKRLSGWCQVFGPGEEDPVLQVDLLLLRYYDVDEEVRHGARRLPEIAPGAEGYYYPDVNPADGRSTALASLIRGQSQLFVVLNRGGPGRDPAADVVGLITLIGPRLLPDEDHPTPAPTKKQGA